MIRETPTFKKYRVVAELDSGGMANVYLCVSRGVAGVNKLHVLKQMRRELLESDTALEMFLDEARLAARLNHPNVVQTHEIGEEDGRYFLTMEYLDGQSLATALRHHGKSISLDLQLRVLCDALAGLHYAHELKNFDGKPLGIVHRDVSPQNIFITYAGQVKLLDFGIAKANSSEGKTQAGTLKGKIAFMSPEQVVGGEVDRRADVFAMGAMLWGAVAGKPMWAGLSDVTIVKSLVSGDIPSPKSMNANVPPELQTIVTKALAPAPEDRYQTAAELRAELEAYLTKHGARVSAEDAGALIQGLFAGERARVSKTIEEHMRVLVAEPNRDHTPIALPSVRPQAPISAVTNNAVAVTVSGNPAHAPQATGGRWKLAAAAGAVAALVLGGAIVVGKVFVAAPPAEPVAAKTPEKGEIDINIRATPREARLFLDDTPLGSNPYVGKRPRGSGLHELRIEARDGATETRTVTFERDVLIEVAVAPARPTLAAVMTAAAPTPPPVETTARVFQAAPRPHPAANASAKPTPSAPAAAPATTSENVGKHAKPRPSLDKIDL